MNDPWHQETLDGLVAYVEAAKEAGGTAWALVVVSSERLGGRVIGELAERIGGVDELRLCSYVDPRDELDRRLGDAPSSMSRTTVVFGATSLGEEASAKLLRWLNFNRERFERPAEAFVFVVSSDLGHRWSKEAPDFDRYVQRFEVMDLDDRIEREFDEAADADPGVERETDRLESAEQRLALVRSLQDRESLADALGGVYFAASRLGRDARAKEVLAESLSLFAEDEPKSSKVRLMQSHRYSVEGQAERSLAALESLGDEPLVGGRLANARGLALSYVGRTREALVEHRRGLREATGNDYFIGLSNIADEHRWLGEVQEAIKCIHEAELHMLTAPTSSLLELDLGHTARALDEATMALRLSRTVSVHYATVWALSVLGRISMESGCLWRALHLTKASAESPSGRSARSYGWVRVRGETLWHLHGPAGLDEIERAEVERQRGWDAPIPAAVLVYLRGLGSSTDEDARHHLGDAADRYRSMGGLYTLSEVERWLARLDRLEGHLGRAQARIDEGLAWHVREGTRPREARDRTELSLIALGRGEPQLARAEATRALELVHACGTRLYEPAALVALAAAERALGHTKAADVHDQRWRRLVRGIEARGLEAALERDAAWAAAFEHTS